MRIALVGYGKMGKAIETIATNKGHVISAAIGSQNSHLLDSINPTNTDVVIEFTRPEAALKNILTCLQKKVPVVCGTTGWLQHYEQVKEVCLRQETAFLFASNFSVGVNLFFYLNEILAQKMANYPTYQAEIVEVHHTQKLDAPSGTAITLAEGILAHMPNLKSWVNAPTTHPHELPIISVREGDVYGIHSITYRSEIDSIEIKHTAHSRQGFASGAVMAAEWLHNKKGLFTMKDVLGI